MNVCALFEKAVAFKDRLKLRGKTFLKEGR
jgi:hypothetical protein